MDMIEKNKRVEDQIESQKRTVDYDTREFTIEIIVQKYTTDFDSNENEIFVPDYQREFTWDDIRQSKFIESIILGLPIPLIFLAEDGAGRLEIVDGSQRIRTLASFLGGDLELKGLKKLTEINGLKYKDLERSRRRKINNSALKMIVLRNDTTDEIKNDIFERINRGSDPLFAMEKRKGIFKGDFNDFIYNECAKNEDFINMTPLGAMVSRRQEREELILRFFAFYDTYPSFSLKRGLSTYLDEYLQRGNEKADKKYLDSKKAIFNKMIEFVKTYYPRGFVKQDGAHQVSRIYFEAISVGTALALDKIPDLSCSKDQIIDWLDNGQLIQLTAGKYRTHSKENIIKRIEYVFENLVGKK